MWDRMTSQLRRPAVLAALTAAAVAVLVVVVLVAFATSDPGATETSKPSAASSSTPTGSPMPSTTPTPTETAAAEAAPTTDTPAAQPGAAPAPAPAPAEDPPGVIAMNPGPLAGCGEYPSGQTIYRNFSWGAREGNTVDIYVAYTETSVQATGGFFSMGSGLAANGSVDIPRTCPNGEGLMPMVTVKVVASNSQGSATAYYWGI